MKAGLIQIALRGSTAESPDSLRDKMLAAHAPLIERAGAGGVRVLCLQEICTQPYFCAEVNDRWFAAAEAVPDGPTIRAMQDHARRHRMVLVVPVFERDGAHYFNTAAVIDADGRYLGKYRKTHIPDLPQGREAHYFRPSELGYPVFETACCKLGVYICYDRHFPEGWRALALNGAQLVMNPCATVEGLSRHLWQIEQPAAAVANGYFVGTINRVGVEAPWGIGRFYGSSYFVDPRGQIVAQAGDSADELLVADLDLGLVDQVRRQWGFFEKRQPATYGDLLRS